MPTIFVSSIDPDSTIKLTGENAHYVTRVLRASVGDTFVLMDEASQRCRAVVDSIERSEVTLSVTEMLPPEHEPAFGVSLVMGLLKGSKMDLVVQKATELGVKQIIPLITERTQLKHTRKTDRWRKIALEATRQCGRASVSEVHEPIDISELDTLMTVEFTGVVFWEDSDNSPLAAQDVLAEKSNAYLVIGPEGGLTEKEVATLKDKGFKVRSLGKNILRAETAAIAAVTLAQYHLGRMG